MLAVNCLKGKNQSPSIPLVFKPVTAVPIDLGNSAGLGIIRAPSEVNYLPGIADVAELVDALDLGSSIERCGSSSLPVRTTLRYYTVQ